MSKGLPRLCMRLPIPVMNALRQYAQDTNRTLTDILRKLAIDELERAGYSLEPEKEEGSNA